MRLRHIPGSEEAVSESPYVLDDPGSYKGHFRELFSDLSPLKIEIGCGKGKFITELAQADPGGIYIGIERYSSVLFYALRKLEGKDIPNLRFICGDAAGLNDIFAPGEVDEIYLNFPDPWPKDRHEKRRLTSPAFLAIYKDILKEEGLLELKTDNISLFDYSADTLCRAGYRIIASTKDLYESDLAKGNVPTEYEIRFSGKGDPICKLVAAAEQTLPVLDNAGT